MHLLLFLSLTHKLLFNLTKNNLIHIIFSCINETKTGPWIYFVHSTQSSHLSSYVL